MDTIVNVVQNVREDSVRVERAFLVLSGFAAERPELSAHSSEVRTLSKGMIFHLFTEKAIQEASDELDKEDDESVVG